MYSMEICSPLSFCKQTEMGHLYPAHFSEKHNVPGDKADKILTLYRRENKNIQKSWK